MCTLIAVVFGYHGLEDNFMLKFVYHHNCMHHTCNMLSSLEREEQIIAQQIILQRTWWYNLGLEVH
jgi:hypothetical protein